MEPAPNTLELPIPDPQAYARIAEVVYRHTGIQLGPGKNYFVVGRLGGLYRSLGCSDWGELPRHLSDADDELVDALVRAVVTPETRFFRDELPFRALEERIVPDVTGDLPRGAPLRVWSAGCSTGQEPYSVAMALWHRVSARQITLEVIASDICHASLERAERGVYGPLELGRGLDAASRRAFFETQPGDRAVIREEVRERVRFERRNLITDPPPRSDFQVVFCRNVAIYFDVANKRRLYANLARALVPGGYLVLGAAETLFPSVQGFETVYFERSLLFRKVVT